jgi:hypothetical protein
MESFLKSAALCDLNAGPAIIHSESSTTQMLKQSAALTAAGSGANAGGAGGAGGGGTGEGQKRGSFTARGSFLAKLQQGNAANEDRGMGEDDSEPAHRFCTPKHILTHISPDIQVASASLALDSYHDPLNSLMAKVSSESLYIVSIAFQISN